MVLFDAVVPEENKVEKHCARPSKIHACTTVPEKKRQQ